MTGPAESIIPNNANTAQCPVCGYAVEKRGQLCEMCQQKQDARGPRGSELLRPMHSAVAPKDGPPVEKDTDAEDFGADDDGEEEET